MRLNLWQGLIYRPVTIADLPLTDPVKFLLEVPPPAPFRGGTAQLRTSAADSFGGGWLLGDIDVVEALDAGWLHAIPATGTREELWRYSPVIVPAHRRHRGREVCIWQLTYSQYGPCWARMSVALLHSPRRGTIGVRRLSTHTAKAVMSRPDGRFELSDVPPRRVTAGNVHVRWPPDPLARPDEGGEFIGLATVRYEDDAMFLEADPDVISAMAGDPDPALAWPPVGVRRIRIS